MTFLLIHGIDISNYIFEFEMMLGNKQVLQVYFEFLKQELNSELLLFTQEVLDLQQLTQQQGKQQDAVTLANHIMET